MDKHIGFCVLYRFRVRPGFEDRFQQGWRRLTETIRDQRGGLGSRLHRADDGWWIAYAQWPDRDTWQRAQQQDAVDAEAAGMMADSILERKPPVLMNAKIDLLLPA